MRTLHLAAGAAAILSVTVAALAFASGGPPPPEPAPPELRTVVAHGSASVRVEAPKRRTDATIQRAVDVARDAALPRAVADARAEADQLARAARLTLTRTLGVEREVPTPGNWDPDTGRFGPGRWCGNVSTRSRPRSRRICPVPPIQTARVTLTVATE